MKAGIHSQALEQALKLCVLYCRVSSKEQEEEGWSIPCQLREGRAWAKRNGYTILREFVEAHSARNTGRAEFAKMLIFLASNPGTIIVTEKTDRIFRNRRDSVAVETQQITSYLIKEDRWVRPDSRAHDKLIHNFKVMLAEHYSDNLSEEIRKGLLEKAQQGIYPTHAPLGYLNAPEPGTKRKRIEVDPARGPLVRRLLLEYATGLHSIKTLTKFAADIGLRTKKGHRVQKSGIQDILRNPAYCGTVRWNGEDFEGSHEPLVSKAVWRTIQNIMAGRNNNRTGYGSLEFAYRGLIRCDCGRIMTAERKKGRYVYYHCTGAAGTCTRPYVKEEALDVQFAALLEEVAIPDFIHKELTRLLKSNVADQTALRRSREDQLCAEVGQLKRRLEKLYEDYLDQNVSKAVYDSKRGQWEAQLGGVESALDELASEELRSYDESIEILELAKSAHIRFKSASPSDKRELLQTILSNCQFAHGFLSVTYNPPFDLLYKTVSAKPSQGPDLEVNQDWWRQGDSNP